jgi:hypothetical protein
MGKLNTMLSKGCSYVTQNVQTKRYVDTVAEKLIKTVSWKGTRQHNTYGNKTVSRRCPCRGNAQNACRGRTHENGTRAAARQCRHTVAAEKSYKRVPQQENLVRSKYCVFFFLIWLQRLLRRLMCSHVPLLCVFLLTRNSA